MPNHSHELYYGSHLIAHVTEDMSNCPSTHCTIDLSVCELEEAIRHQFDAYHAHSVEHHRIFLTGDLEKIKNFEQDPFPNDLKELIWSLKILHNGVHMRIRRPYFGVNNYMRYSMLPQQKDYDVKKLAGFMRQELSMLISTLGNESISLSKERCQDHIKCLGFLSNIANNIERRPDLADAVNKWFRHLADLNSEIDYFKAFWKWGQLDEHCVIPKQV